MRKRLLIALSLGALAVAARLPFLITGKIPFDSDEAVEGLMAKHVLSGEFPAFFWGQAFKGVPEVYGAAGAFAAFGPSVSLLKGVTLVFFAAYVALNFILLCRMTSRWVAAAASSLLILAPPALVFWSLDASAEYIFIMLLGTILLLLCVRLEDAGRGERIEQPSKRALFSIGLVTGLGLWVHQLFIVYLFPISMIFALRREPWQKLRPDKPGTLALAVAAVSAIYVGLSIVAFLTGGFSLRLGPVALSATAPQKMLRIAIGIGALALAIHLTRRLTRGQVRRWVGNYWPGVAGFVIGYLPVLLYTALVGPARSPARNANLRQLASAAPDILGNVVPILGGFKIATTERLPIPLIAVVPGVAALAAYIWSNRQRLSRVMTWRAPDATIAADFFPIFVIFVPALFLVSGAYVDTQSYRYLIPWYAGISVAWASGSWTVGGQRWTVATAILGTILGVHAWQQAIWYRMLTPDMQSIATIDCLKRHGIRGGYAEYWTSYKLTFLADEEIIIAPTDGVDRYPAYTQFVKSLPAQETVRLKPDTTHCMQ